MKSFQRKHKGSIRSLQCVILVLLLSALCANAQLPQLPQSLTVFSPPQNVSNNAGDSLAQQIAIGPQGDIYIVWLDNTPGYNAVFFSRSVDNGVTFSQPQNLSNDPRGSSAPKFAVDSCGNINVVWEAPDSYSGTAFFTRSNDRGFTFSTPVAIADDVNTPPNLALDSSGNIYVGWWDYQTHNVFLSRSNDGGNTFSVPVQVSHLQLQAPQPAGGPLLAVDSSERIDVLWEFSSNQASIDFNYSTDGGSTFSQDITISGNLEIPSPIAMTLDSAGDINVVWNTTPQQPLAVVLSRSVDGGQIFVSTSPMNPFPYPNQPCCEQVAVDPAGGIDLVWGVQDSDNIAFNRSQDGGMTFSTTTFSNAHDPQLAVDSRGDIDLVWTSGSEIFFSRSSDFGTTFSTPQNVSGNIAGSSGPRITTDQANNIDVTWVSNAPSNYDVFFSRGILINPPCPPLGLE